MRLEGANSADLLASRSLVCAAAQSSTALIIGRAIAGAGVSGVFTGSIMVVVRCGKSFRELSSIDLASLDSPDLCFLRSAELAQRFGDPGVHELMEIDSTSSPAAALDGSDRNHVGKTTTSLRDQTGFWLTVFCRPWRL